MVTARPPAHIRLTAAGVFLDASAQPVEIFSTGLAAGTVDGSAPHADQLTGAVDAFRAAFDTFMEASVNGVAYFSTHTVVTEYKAALISADGHYDGVLPVVRVVTVPGVNDANTTSTPLQLACAVTLRTQADNRRSGRMFLPYPIGISLSSYRMRAGGGPPSANSLAGDLATMLRTTNTGLAALPQPMRLVVASTGGKTGVPVLRPIVGCAVGDVPDTIRTRRNKLRETYQSAVL